MQRIYSAQNTLMVDHLQRVLEAEGIDAVVRNRFLAGAAGQLPPAECWTELWLVDEARLPDAQRIIQMSLDRDHAVSGDTWECQRCGERLDPQFEACWKCSTSRGEVPPDPGTLDSPAARRPPRTAVRLPTQLRFWAVLALMALAAWYMATSTAAP